MSDQDATEPQPTSDERQTKTNQPEQQQRNNERHRDRSGRRRHPQQSQQSSQQQPTRRSVEPSLNLDELRELVELIAQHGFTDFELEREGIRVRLRREVAPQTAAAPVASTLQSQTPAQQAANAAPPVHAAQETQSAPPPATARTEAAATATAAPPEEELHIIPSPIVGTFYRSPSPQSEPFVRLGSHVQNDTVVCIIEAMKLMNEIQAETSGEIAKIYVENGQPVEYGQPLFGIKK